MNPFSSSTNALPAAAGGLALAAILLISTPVPAQDDHHHAYTPDEIEFQPGPPTLPAGVQFAVLVGSPAEKGPFVMRLKFPGGYEIPPHRHPEEEHVTVISGGFGMALGEAHDRAVAELLRPGSFVRIPTGEAHFAWTEEETIVQINAIGPFGIEYVNPGDDPRAN